LPREYRNHLALYEGISAEHSSIDDIVRKARRYEKALVTIRSGRGSDRDSPHNRHVNDARGTESHEDGISPELGDMSDGGLVPVREREVLRDQDDGSESSQYDEDSEAGDSLTAERDEDSEEENSYFEEFDGSAAPSDEDGQDYGPDGARYDEDPD
jgi:hypothetical protein